MRPYYVLMRLPGEDDETFVLILPFTPLDRLNMVAWLAAKSDPGPAYGDIVSFEFPSGVNVDGPTQVFSRINQDARFSAERTLLGQGGSSIVFGDFLRIPLQDPLLDVQPVYVQSNQENAIPELKRGVVANGSAIGIDSSLRAALTAPPRVGGAPRGGRAAGGRWRPAAGVGRGAEPGAARPGDPALRRGGRRTARRRSRHLPTGDRGRQGGDRAGPAADRQPARRAADGLALALGLALGLALAVADPLRLTVRLLRPHRGTPRPHAPADPRSADRKDPLRCDLSVCRSRSSSVCSRCSSQRPRGPA